MCTDKTKERCPYCLSTDLRPKGWNRKKTKRRFKCSDCKKHITQDGHSWFINASQLKLIDKLLLERISLRGICRVLEISLTWLLCYIKKWYGSQSDDLNYRIPTNSTITLKLIDSELDEMWSYVGDKSNKKWVWIAQCRQTRQVIAFHVGDRSSTAAKELWAKLPLQIQEFGLFYSDDWDAYKGVFPKDRHIFSTQKRDTNHLERLNNTIRQRVSRLVRKS